MEAIKDYEIEFAKLKNGKHQYDYSIGGSFFENFDADIISNGKVAVTVLLDKTDNLFELDIVHKGYINLSCDRCLDTIDYPVEGKQKMVIKQGAENEEEDENVLLITAEALSINVGQVIYELICTSLPLVRYCEEADKECNQEMVSKINGNEEETPNGIDPRWDKLKNLYNK